MEFDIESLTLGECLAVEEASGKDLQQLISSTSGRLLLAVFVDRLRNSGETPNWQDLTHLRLLDTSRGPSQSPRANRSAKSSV